MNPDMTVHLCGVEFKNPVIGASGTFAFGLDMADFFDISKIGGMSMKALTIEPRQGNDPIRIVETPSGILNSVGLQNPGVDAFIENILPQIEHTDIVKIANVAGREEDDYYRVIEKLNDTCVDMFELNVSCPKVKHGGATFGTDPAVLRSITEGVKRRAKKPLIVKLTPNVTSIAQMARAAEEGGADAVSLINTLTGMAIDVRTRRPILANITGGLSGPCVKPVALRMVREVYQTVDIPIVGMGGIMTGEDAAEFMIAGASLIMVGTASLVSPDACLRVAEELERFCRQQEIGAVRELTGTLAV